LLDAAHGGDEGGAQLANGTAEKTVTLALSVRLRSLLAARGFQVFTTRESNIKLTPDQRAEIANPLNAAACLSLHATEAGSGVHIFVSSQEPREQTRFLAWKTAQGAFVTRSLRLASVVNSAFEHNAGSSGSDSEGASASASYSGSGSGSDVTPIPVTLGRTALQGVDSMTCPAVAVEMAPIRGDDRKVVTDVTDPQYQTRVVGVLAAAILEWQTDLDTSSVFGSTGRLP